MRLSADGKQWKSVSHRNDAIGVTARLGFEPTACRYVQVCGHKPDGPSQVGYQMSLAELELYADGADRE